MAGGIPQQPDHTGQEAQILENLELKQVQLKQLEEDFEGLSLRHYLIPGVRALIESPNPGRYCSGIRCEYRRSPPIGWYRHLYFRRGERCFVRILGRCNF